MNEKLRIISLGFIALNPAICYVFGICRLIVLVFGGVRTEVAGVGIMVQPILIDILIQNHHLGFWAIVDPVEWLIED